MITQPIWQDRGTGRGLGVYANEDVDYQKAYNEVNRSLLLNYLGDKGCGNRFLRALGQSLQRALNALGCESFVSTMGVRQGGPMSCSLFTLLIDYTIDKLRTLGPDRWLQDLHTLLLMDDNTVVASSRTSMERKLHVLQQAARDIGMDIHPGKSQFLILANVVVAHTDQYTYLRSPISNATMSRQIAAHMQAQITHTFKFSSFCHKNADAPKRAHTASRSSFWDNALQSAILYSSETWLTLDLNCLIHPYLRTVKELVGVRSQCCTDTLLVETGIPPPPPPPPVKGLIPPPPVKGLILSRQKRYLDKLRTPHHFAGSPVQKGMSLVAAARSPISQHISYLVTVSSHPTCDPAASGLQHYHHNIETSATSHRTAHMLVNPGLIVYPNMPWLFHILMPYNIILYFRLSYFHVSNCALFST